MYREPFVLPMLDEEFLETNKEASSIYRNLDLSP